MVGATAVADRQSLETMKTPARLGFSCGGHSCPTDMLRLNMPYVQVSEALLAYSVSLAAGVWSPNVSCTHFSWAASRADSYIL